MMDINPQALTFEELITGRLFRIPKYQRAYSWTTRQREELFDDLRRTSEKETEHFMATIVGLRREIREIKTKKFAVVDVVDGQQRLTTLVLLLKAIQRTLAASVSAEDAEIGSEVRSSLVKGDDVSLLLLQTNHDTSAYYLDYVRADAVPDPADATTFAERELAKAIEECESFVASWVASHGTVLGLLALVRNQLRFIFHEITNESLVYSVFEVLNSRGLDVSWFDRLKSALMGIAFEADGGNRAEVIDELHTIWSDIYTCIGLRPGLSSEALRFAATLVSPQQLSKPLGEQSATTVLRDQTKGTVEGVISVSRWILRVTRAVERMHGDVRLVAVTRILHARLLAVAILVRDDLGSGAAPLEAWERVSFRIFGLSRKDARTKVGDYVRLARECWLYKPSADDLTRKVYALGSKHPITVAAATLRDADCYDGWEEELRYFLFRYEEFLSKKQGQKFDNEQWKRIWADSPSRSIEHVLAQSAGPAEPSSSEIFVHRLGNLLLLPPGLNSKLGAKSPAEKQDAYVKTGLFIAIDVAGRVSDWTRDAVVKREEELIAWAEVEWGDQPDEVAASQPPVRETLVAPVTFAPQPTEAGDDDASSSLTDE